MLLCQQKGIVPNDDEEILENNGPINEASIERMTRGKDTPTMNEAETEGTNLTEDDLRDRDRSVESPPIVHIFDVEKEEDSRDVEECMRQVDSLVEVDFITGKEAPVVEEEVVVEEEEVLVKVVNEKAEEENTETKAAEKEFVEDIVNASEFVDATTDNLSEMELDHGSYKGNQ
ncbi:hypothetical protein V6Z12_D08G084100 [Gossypium hirsutum]